MATRTKVCRSSPISILDFKKKVLWDLIKDYTEEGEEYWDWWSWKNYVYTLFHDKLWFSDILKSQCDSYIILYTYILLIYNWKQENGIQPREREGSRDFASPGRSNTTERQPWRKIARPTLAILTVRNSRSPAEIECHLWRKVFKVRALESLLAK